MSHIYRLSSCIAFGLTCFICLCGSDGRAQNIEITDAGFSPAAITVNQGSEVFWFNSGSMVHSARAASGEWNSGRIQPLDYYSTFVTRTGSLAYACSQHPTETGVVTVITAVIPPSVSVFYPADQTRFGQPAEFSLQVLASDSDGSVTNVAFFADGVAVGNDVASPYQKLVSDLSPGAHSLVAQAADNQGYTATSAPVNITVTSPAGGEVWRVDALAWKFTPGILNIAVGDTVVFRNLDPTNHTATGTFTSREALGGATQLTATRACTNTFNFAGSFEYFCGLHPNERGTVTVSQATSPPLRLLSPTLSGEGRFQFDWAAAPSQTCVVQTTTNLILPWTSVQTNQAATNIRRFVDSEALRPAGQRFFRVFRLQ